MLSSCIWSILETTKFKCLTRWAFFIHLLLHICASVPRVQWLCGASSIISPSLHVLKPGRRVLEQFHSIILVPRRSPSWTKDNRSIVICATIVQNWLPDSGNQVQEQAIARARGHRCHQGSVLQWKENAFQSNDQLSHFLASYLDCGMYVMCVCIYNVLIKFFNKTSSGEILKWSEHLSFWCHSFCMSNGGQITSVGKSEGAHRHAELIYKCNIQKRKR